MAKKNSFKADYIRRGKKLTPHLLTIPALKLESWGNVRLPEMLWAALIRSNLDQMEALLVFSSVGEIFNEVNDREDVFPDIRLSGIAKLPSDIKGRVLDVICTSRTIPHLSAMLVFDTLPGKEIWESRLETVDEETSWMLLADAVQKCMFHQSDEATDCRAAKIFPMIAKGMVQFVQNNGIKEMLDDLHKYPSGDEDSTAHARASIRALEGGMIGAMLDQNQENWADPFWEECFKSTGCYVFESKDIVRSVEVDENSITELRGRLIRHSMETIMTTGIDPRHETAFGVGLYALNLVAELLESQNQYSSSGRITLRTLAELYIYLKWLEFKNEPDLWDANRKYGSGQAKLQLEKIKESEDKIHFADQNTLDEIANEDQADRFLEIELGHWSGTNLRQMSIDAGAKQIYDNYYNWTSSYSHGGWGAIRESNLQNCANPLHRFHIIPRIDPKKLPSVLPDSIYLMNLILEMISEMYPEFNYRLSKKNNKDKKVA